MKKQRISGCIFVDTPRECRYIDLSKCPGDSERLACIFNHLRLRIAEDTKQKLVEAFIEELNTERRCKDISGLAGRKP